MLRVFFTMQGKTVELPSLPPGGNGSFTDYAKPDREIIMMEHLKDKVNIWLSKKGFSIEHGITAHVSSSEKELEKEILPGKSYERTFTNKFGVPCTVKFIYEDPIHHN